MKITQLKEPNDELWQHFWDFFISSKPYDLGGIRSPYLKRKKIQDLYDYYFENCIVYIAKENDKLKTAIFLHEEESFFDVTFIFGVSKNFTSASLISTVHDIFDLALKEYNKNYIKSEIRRKHKVKSYKKWIERYDKRAIIFNDPPNTVVWCKSNRMKAQFKVVGTNQATEHLMGETASLTQKFVGSMRELTFGEEKYFFDEKSVDFLRSCVVVNGFLSDDKENVGRVALEFIPQNEK